VLILFENGRGQEGFHCRMDHPLHKLVSDLHIKLR
jgi:hypothetical protein